MSSANQPRRGETSLRLDRPPAEMAVDLAYFAGWIEHASINSAKKAELSQLLMTAARRLAVRSS